MRDTATDRLALTVVAQLPAAVGDALDNAVVAAYAAVDHDLLDLCRARVRQLLRVPSQLSRARDGQLADWPRSTAFDRRERACLAFTDQFVTDVNTMTSELTDAVLDEVGAEGLHGFTFALYALEQAERLRLAVEALETGHSVVTPPRLPVAPDAAPAQAQVDDLAAALDGYQRSVVQLEELDPITTELVRLRCAGYHGCRRCQSLRLVPARANGVDETMVAKVADFERSDLSERHRAALRFADAYLLAPASLGPTLVEPLLAHFTTSQILELVLDISKWSYQKGLVALELDAVDPARGALLLDFDEAGRPVLISDEA